MSPTHQDLSNDTTFSQIKSRVPDPLSLHFSFFVPPYLLKILLLYKIIKYLLGKAGEEGSVLHSQGILHITLYSNTLTQKNNAYILFILERKMDLPRWITSPWDNREQKVKHKKRSTYFVHFRAEDGSSPLDY